ncbi:MAG: pyruvate dehydrogenase subunit beta [Deltaproteobacteria bacterium]|jgi:pyruvate dehydrogenase E1 component beta subunit|nr:pyruvate dehydrogenase subunit beta [Deltaproteobacteria bacterium]
MTRELSFREAITEALAEEMRRDPCVILLGEDVRLSLMGQTAGLVNEFGTARIINTPVAENAITGVAIGAAMNGLRPVLELLLCDFALLAMDQICNNLAQWRYVTGGQYPLPVTIRTTVGGGFGLGFGHSQCLESMFLQVPGLILIEPSTPYDAKGLLTSAIRSDDPVIFFEHKKLLWKGERGEVPEEGYAIPFGQAAVRREGKDVTVAALGCMVGEALAAAQELAREGIECEVIDLRTIVPLDTVALVSSLEKTGRMVVAEEGRLRGGVGAEIAAMICEDHFTMLKAPVQRVGAPMIPVPGSPHLERLYLPNKDAIVKSIKQIM